MLRADRGGPSAYEAHQPPLYYFVAALATFGIDASDYESLVRQNPHVAYDPLSPTNKQLYVHTRREAWPHHRAVLAMRLARWGSVLFGVGAIIGTYGLARTLFPQRPELWASAAACLASLPQFGAVNGTVSNDSAITCMIALTLWQLARVYTSPTLPTSRALTKSMVWLGVLLGLRH